MQRLFLIMLSLAVVFVACGKNNVDDREFINPYGGFKIDEINGEYVVIPEMSVDAALFESLFHEGGWAYGEELKVTPDSVCVFTSPISGTDAVWVSESEGAITEYYLLELSDYYYRNIPYSIEGNILYTFGRVYGMICYIDSDKLIIVADTKEENCWTLRKFTKASDEEVQKRKDKSIPQ